MIEIFTDGACSGNPGPGGYGIILSTILKGEIYSKELSQGFRRTTNNRMELLAVIVALEALRKPGNDVVITSDSRYVVDAVEKKWLDSWLKKDFKSRKNKDLWLRYLKVAATQNVTFKWVKGHHLDVKNKRCDVLAVNAYKQINLLIDGNFEDENPQGDNAGTSLHVESSNEAVKT